MRGSRIGCFSSRPKIHTHESPLFALSMSHQDSFPPSSSRRRPYPDSVSISSASPPPQAAALSTKRTRTEEPMAAVMDAGPGGLAKGKGRLAETIDLTRPSAFQPNNGARKLVIKNLRPHNPARDAKVAQYYQQTEAELVGALDAIFDGRKPPVPFERLFRAVEDMCRKGDAEKVYRALRDRLDSHVTRQITPRILAEGGNSNFLTLKSVQAHWSTFNAQMVRQAKELLATDILTPKLIDPHPFDVQLPR